MRATWRVMLQGAIDEAILAVDLYNQPREPRRLEAFLVHMHLAWLYLLHAEFRRAGTDYRYRLKNGRFDRIDGEPRTWELQRSARERWPVESDPVRKNLELTIGLRNKVEHRFHEATTIVTSGYAQALLLNFEEEVVTAFGPEHSLGTILRFPIFVGSLTGLGKAKIEALKSEVPKDTRDFIASFESALDSTVAEDQRFEFRINLVPKLGSKTDADSTMSYIRESDLTDDERAALVDLGKSGKVIVREQSRPVASLDLHKPTEAAKLIEAKVPFKIGTHHVVLAWKAMKCRPEGGAKFPERTDARYCVYDMPHRDYLYTKAFIERVAKEAGTAKRFEDFFGRVPEPNPDPGAVVQREIRRSGGA